PVNSSAPPTTTSTRPSEKTSPADNRTSPYGIAPEVPAVTVVEKTAPRAMNAPANTPSTNILVGSMLAFLTPISSALTAISAGNNESSWNLSWRGIGEPSRTSDGHHPQQGRGQSFFAVSPVAQMDFPSDSFPA